MEVATAHIMKARIEINIDAEVLKRWEVREKQLRDAGFCANWTMSTGVLLGQLTNAVGFDEADAILMDWIAVIKETVRLSKGSATQG